MEMRQCGRSGLWASSIGLGTLTWGRDTDLHEASDMLTHFVDAGGTLVEGAAWHGDGAAGDVIAHAIRTVGRHRVTLAWRGGRRVGAAGLSEPLPSRGSLMAGLDGVLARLDIDYVDLWLVQPSKNVPLEETLSAMQWAADTGRAHYVGLDNATLWDTAQASWAGLHTHSPAISVLEGGFNILQARQRQEILQAAKDHGLGFFAHSPLAAGVMTGKYRHSPPPDSRASSEHLAHTVTPFLQPELRGLVEATARAADGLEMTTAGVALSWVLQSPGITSAIIGPRNLRQLEQLLEDVTVLPAPIMDVLNEVAGV